MLRIDNEQALDVRNPGRPDSQAGIVRRIGSTEPLFRGWGPKLMAVAFALTSVAISQHSAQAATQVSITVTCASPNHSASLISEPAVQKPDGVGADGESIIRVDLSETGRVDSMGLVQTSGNFDLDWAAFRIARDSRYAPATQNCEGSRESVLYDVVFTE